MVDARDLKSLDGNGVWVRVPPPAPRFALTGYAWRSHAKTAKAKRVRRSLNEVEAKTDCILKRYLEGALYSQATARQASLTSIEAKQAKAGGRDRDRTCDPYHVKVVLSR